MQIIQKQLLTHLKEGLQPIYLIHGNVPLLAQQARDCIRQHANAAGFDQYEYAHVETGYDWNQFSLQTQNQSLFSQKQIIDIRNSGAKFDDKALKALQHYCENANQDIIVIITTDKLTSAQQKSRWYKTIDTHGVCVAVWPVTLRELPTWIRTQMQKLKLNADTQSIALLADLTEGNLLATWQAIEKLKLLYANQPITPQAISAVTTDNARFNVFDLANYLLQGDAKRCVRIIHGLRDEGVEVVLVLWLITRECRELFNLSQQFQQGIPLTQVVAKQWQSRKALVTQALKRLDTSLLGNLLQWCARIDAMIKGVSTGNAWDEITQLALTLSGVKGFTHAL